MKRLLGLLLVCLLGFTVLAQEDIEGALSRWDYFVGSWVWQTHRGTDYIFEIARYNGYEIVYLELTCYMVQDSPRGEIETDLITDDTYLTLYPSQGSATYAMASTYSSYASFRGYYLFERIYPDESGTDQLKVRIFSGDKHLGSSSDNTITEYMLIRYIPETED